jgi:aspartyl/asparaginyl-tRNA synthetase
MGCRLTIRARTLFSGKHFKCPVILFDYPANIKAFYMRLNEDGKQFAPWTFFPDREIVEDHKEKSVLMFWSKNESLGN